MPSVELGKLQAVTGPRALSEQARSAIETGARKPAGSASTQSPAGGVSIELGAAAAGAVEAASPPVDKDRVAEIRDALRDGSYPLVPTEIADAMIAAQLSYEQRA